MNHPWPVSQAESRRLIRGSSTGLNVAMTGLVVAGVFYTAAHRLRQRGAHANVRVNNSHTAADNVGNMESDG